MQNDTMPDLEKLLQEMLKLATPRACRYIIHPFNVANLTNSLILPENLDRVSLAISLYAPSTVGITANHPVLFSFTQPPDVHIPYVFPGTAVIMQQTTPNNPNNIAGGTHTFGATRIFNPCPTNRVYIVSPYPGTVTGVIIEGVRI